MDLQATLSLEPERIASDWEDKAQGELGRIGSDFIRLNTTNQTSSRGEHLDSSRTTADRRDISHGLARALPGLSGLHQAVLCASRLSLQGTTALGLLALVPKHSHLSVPATTSIFSWLPRDLVCTPDISWPGRLGDTQK